jgi:hypothetical protein
MSCCRDVGVLVTLGPDYSWLEVQVEGDADPRHPASIKCTSINPAAKRHLRHVTPGSSSSSTRLRRFGCDVLQAPPPSVPTAAAEGGEGVQEGEGGQQQLQVLELDSAGAGFAAIQAAHADGVQAGHHGSDSPTAESAVQQAGPSGGDGVSEAEGPSVSLPPAAEAGASLSIPHPTPAGHYTAIEASALPLFNPSSSSSSSSGLPIGPLELPSGQLGMTHSISFLLPEELQQQGGQHGAALLPQKGERGGSGQACVCEFQKLFQRSERTGLQDWENVRLGRIVWKACLASKGNTSHLFPGCCSKGGGWGMELHWCSSTAATER